MFFSDLKFFFNRSHPFYLGISICFIFLATAVAPAIWAAEAQSDRGKRQHPTAETNVQTLQEQLPNGLFPHVANTLQNDASFSYRVIPTSSGYQFQNPTHNLNMHFSSQGVRLFATDGSDWHWGMRLYGYGREGHIAEVSPTQPNAEGNRVEYGHSGITEWYVNGPLGLQQGFTISHAPHTHLSGRLVVRVGLSGDVMSEVSERGESVALRQVSGSAELLYGGLYVYDSAGKTLPARLEATPAGLSIVVDDVAAQYPITIDPFVQEARLSAPVGEVPKARAYFGYSVSVSGNTTVIGARGDDYNTGAAYVFTNNGGTWTETKLTADDGAGGDHFGRSVSILGNTIVVGAEGDDDGKGSVYVFSNAGGSWTQASKLTADDGVEGDWFGFSVSISGNTIVVGAYRDDDKGISSGSAYVFSNEGGAWTQSAKLIADDGDSSDWFGRSVSISGNTVVIGAWGDDDKGSVSGSAYVFSNAGGTWTQTGKLTADDGERFDRFGFSVSISGNTILVGAYGDDDRGSSSGSAYVFSNAGGSWTQASKLTADDGAGGDTFGISVVISDHTIVVGANRDDVNDTDSGSAYVFSNDGGTWIQTGKLTADEITDGVGYTGYDNFGRSVSISGNTIVVGADGNDANGRDSGGAYVFIKPDTDWNDKTQDAKLAASDGVASISKSVFGSSVSADGNTVVIGAPGDDYNTGAAYVFTNNGGTWTQASKLTADDGAGGDRFGYSVSISGNTIVIGAYGDNDKGSDSGSAYVFSNDGGTWTQVAKLTADDGASFDSSGYSVSISGNTIVIGAYRDDDKGSDSGSAYVFSNDGGTWTQVAKLTADDGASFDNFGYSVSISGNTIVIGAYRDDDKGSDSGSAYVFSNDGGSWNQAAKLTADDGAEDDNFGISVSIDGNTIVVGARYEDENDDNSGAVYVFSNEGGSWNQTAKLMADDDTGNVNDQFGSSVSIDGGTIVVGAIYDWPPPEFIKSGSAYVFTNEGGAWSPTTKLTPEDGNRDDRFGHSVSIDGSTIVVGTLLNSLSENRDREGVAYVYRTPQGTLLQRADADGNGVIGIPDFLAFIEVFGTANSQFDFDDNGTVGISDFLIFVNDLFGKPVN